MQDLFSEPHELFSESFAVDPSAKACRDNQLMVYRLMPEYIKLIKRENVTINEQVCITEIQKSEDKSLKAMYGLKIIVV